MLTLRAMISQDFQDPRIISHHRWGCRGQRDLLIRRNPVDLIWMCRGPELPETLPEVLSNKMLAIGHTYTRGIQSLAFAC